MYFTIATILFSSTILLIVPFVSVYTKEITDANYIRPMFAYVLVISEFMWIVRKPYHDMVKAVGHFKQTQIGAWVEAVVNIVLSIIFVLNFGMIGVVMGTLTATIIRTVELMYYTSKNILKRKAIYTYKRLLVIAIEIILIVLVVNLIPTIEITNYLNWAIQGVIVFVIASLIVIAINCLIYKENVKSLIEMIKNMKRKR